MKPSTTKLLNTNTGVVTKVLGQHIELQLPRGGRIRAPNRGFEVGEVVCFTLDASGKNIVMIMPKEVADIKVALAQDEDLGHAIMEADNELDDTDGNSEGQEAESNTDLSSGVHRSGLEGGEDNGENAVDHENPDWADDNNNSNPDPSGETAANEVYLLIEQSGVPELGEDELLVV